MEIKGNHKSYVAQAEAELNRRMTPKKSYRWYYIVIALAVGVSIFHFFILPHLGIV